MRTWVALLKIETVAFALACMVLERAGGVIERWLGSWWKQNMAASAPKSSCRHYSRILSPHSPPNVTPSSVKF